MKYKTYKQLTPEQKEEWQLIYKYDYPYSGAMWYIIMTFCLCTILILSYGVVSYQHPEKVTELNKILELGVTILYVFIGEMILAWAIVVYKIYKERKWLKQIGVKK